jgi:hypothetical protein
MVKQLLVVPLVLAVALRGAAAAEPAKASAATVVELSHSPYLALSHGAQILVGHVRSKAAGTSPVAAAEVGTLTFAVDQALAGKSTGTVQLPYGFQTQWTRRPVFTVWPAVNDLLKDNALLLIVVVPGAVDPLAGEMKGGVGAPTNVYILKGPDDPLVGAFKRILEAHSAKGADLEAALLRLANSAMSVERHYAAERAFATLPPDVALRVVEAQLKAAAKAETPASDVDDGLGYLYHLANDSERPPARKLAAARVLLQQAAGEKPDAGGLAMQLLAATIRNGLKAEETVSPELREPLVQAARTASKDATNVQVREAGDVVLSWIKE